MKGPRNWKGTTKTTIMVDIKNGLRLPRGPSYLMLVPLCPLIPGELIPSQYDDNPAIPQQKRWSYDDWDEMQTFPEISAFPGFVKLRRIGI